DFFGYSIDDVRKELRDVAKLAHPDDLKATRKALLNLMRGNSDRYEAQQRIRHQDGRYLPCLARAHVIERDAHGRGPALPAPIRISAA
ncbi:MAG: PAS domain-containing protein, partial [Gammaproteobacteria bacterium]